MIALVVVRHDLNFEQDNEKLKPHQEALIDQVGNVYCSHNCACMKAKLIACSSRIGKVVR